MIGRLAGLCVDTDSSIRATMLAIDTGGCEVALVLDRDRRLAGIVTDGDTRRALLRGASLDDAVTPYISTDFTAVTTDHDRAAVLDLMHARLIGQVPVVDCEGRPVALHRLHDLVAPEEHPNTAVIMAGGKGTRLRPITETVPKPMVTVAGRPILERIVLHLVGSGVSRIFLAVNYMGDQIEAHFGDGERFGAEIEYLREDPATPLGTAGALRLLPPEVRDDRDAILVMNGDLVTSFDVGALLEAHGTADYAATIAARDHAHQVPFGVLETSGSDVVGIEEKPTRSWLVNAGIYALDPALVKDVPPGVEYPITDLLSGALRRGRRVGVHRIDSDWVDVGHHDELRRARGLDS